MSGVGEASGDAAPLLDEDLVEAVLVESAEQPGHDLVAWKEDSVARQHIGRVLIGGGYAPDRFVGGPLDLGGTQVDAITAFLVAAQIRVVSNIDPSAEATDEAVEISLEAAKRDPRLILGMIRTAPPTEFHERIIAADVTGFEERFAGYVDEGVDGLWESLRLTTAELDATKQQGTWKWAARRENDHEIGELRKLEERRVEAHDASGFQPQVIDGEEEQQVEEGELAKWVYEYIVNTDKALRRAQKEAAHGEGSVIVSGPRTQERLERLSAVVYSCVIGEAEIIELMEEGGADSLKLVGIKYMIDRMWESREKQQHADDPAGYVRGERSAEVSDELLELEALYAALAAKNMLLHRQGTQAGMESLVESIGRVEAVLGGLQDRRRQGTRMPGFLALKAGNYTEEEFIRDIQIAGSTWQVVNRFGTSTELAEFESTTYDQVLDAMRRGGVLVQDTAGADASTALSALPAHIRFGMTVEAYGRLEALALEAIGTEGGPVGASSEASVRWYLQTHADRVARDTDRHGRYRRQELRDMERLGAARRMEDFPGQGRLLCYYGDLNLVEGEMGVLEALGAVSGLYRFIDPVGNLPHNPMRDSAVRTQLEALARDEIQVNSPLRSLPDDYLCETAHFIGRMQSHIEPGDILSHVIPNGFATLQVRSNRELVRQIMEAGSYRYRCMELPSELIRFLRSPEDLLVAEPGHIDPRWKPEWKDSTLAIFFNKEDDSPSDLYIEVEELLSRATTMREIEA
jgi:hypothetical protein